MFDKLGASIAALIALLIVVCPFIAHIISCMKAGAAGMLFLGLIIFPYGWLHGLGVIFGWWA